MVTGPPGTYQLTPSHPEYQDFTTADGGPRRLDGYHVGHRTISRCGPRSCRSTRSHSSARRHRRRRRRVRPVPRDCTVQCPVPRILPIARRSPVGPTVIDIAPGNYCLRISKFDSPIPTKEIAFPAIVAVTVPELDQGSDRKRRHRHRPTAGAATDADGNAGRQERRWFDRRHWSSLQIQRLTNTFTENVDVDVNGTTIPNLNPNSTGDRITTAAAAATDQRRSSRGPTSSPTFPTVRTKSPHRRSMGTPPISPSRNRSSSATWGRPSCHHSCTRSASSDIEIALGPGTFPSLDRAFESTDGRADVFLYSNARARNRRHDQALVQLRGCHQHARCQEHCTRQRSAGP